MTEDLYTTKRSLELEWQQEHLKEGKYTLVMVRIDDKRHLELLRQKKELENNRPHDIDAMRRWKHSMGKILQELELFH